QGGFMAAAGIYALEHHIERLKEDHANAKAIATAISYRSFVKLMLPVETNIIIFELDESLTAPQLVARLKEQDILGYAISPNRVRLVTHLDITPAMTEKTIQVFNQL
ncbi:MAG TPA: beta-eliminating lyase-related protein, partial [Chitinophagaceae bacterium]|nr:beta-eliminating lyase-related protein [Chitinophagaceae bacterium]